MKQVIDLCLHELIQPHVNIKRVKSHTSRVNRNGSQARSSFVEVTTKLFGQQRVCAI